MKFLLSLFLCFLQNELLQSKKAHHFLEVDQTVEVGAIALVCEQHV